MVQIRPTSGRRPVDYRGSRGAARSEINRGHRKCGSFEFFGDHFHPSSASGQDSPDRRPADPQPLDDLRAADPFGLNLQSHFLETCFVAGFSWFCTGGQGWPTPLILS